MMDNQKNLEDALRGLADRKTPQTLDLWPKIQARIRTISPAVRTSRYPFRYALVLTVILFAIVTGAATILYRLMLDRGLQSAQDAGLVSDLQQTTEPYIYLGEALRPVYQVSEEQNISAILNWAYADINRVVFQLTISGLQIPTGTNLSDILCVPAIKQNSGEELISYAPDIYPVKIDENSPGKPIEITYLYVFRHPLDSSKHQSLDLDIRFRFGGCNPDKWNDFVGPTPQVVPAIGVYQIRFQVPVQPGVRIFPDQAVTHNQLTVWLEDISFSPSFINARICFNPLQIGFTQPDVVLIDAMITFNSQTVSNNASAPVQPEKVADDTYCQPVWFPAGYSGISADVSLEIKQFTFITDTPLELKGSWLFETKQ